jgi:RHS repeat-associated protein
MRRPSSEGAAGPSATWSSGAYSYDGAGNITRIGTASYTYDAVSRLTSGTLFDGSTGGGNQKTQSYTFDSFGNLTNIAGTSGRATPTSSATNRLNGTGTAYDAAGNLTNWNAAVYGYDHFNQMTDMASGSEHDFYSYTVDDERIWSYDLVRNISHWTLRDLGGKVLRDYLNNGGAWGLGSDYLYRDGLLLAAETPAGQRHYHLDHLGTPRLITSVSGTQVAYHVYYPFGEEATAFNQDTERMKFTGHERDLASPNGPGDDLDYMHARHESPVTGRFLSVDQFISDLAKPQSWNRYSYALGNPLLYVDPDGRTSIKVWQIGQYLVKLFPGDTFHGGAHYHVFLRKGSQTIARVGLEGEVITGAAPQSLLKQMFKIGLTTGFSVAVAAGTMFFDAAPANADDDKLKILGIAQESIAPLAEKMFGTSDTNELTKEQFAKLIQAYVQEQQEQKNKDEKRKKRERNAKEGASSLVSSACFYHGTCS